MNRTFSQNLATGLMGESRIVKYLRSDSWGVLPVYEKEANDHKGPRLFAPGCELIAPDMFAFKPDGRAFFFEAKRKTVFSWYRIGERWTTGIDMRCYKDYLEIHKASPVPIWLLFLHEDQSCPERDEPWPCPTGLFGNSLEYLRTRESHRSDKHGYSGMVYWDVKNLRQIETLEKFNARIEWFERPAPTPVIVTPAPLSPIPAQLSLEAHP